MSHTVTIFKPYELKPGQKIRIVGSRRGGDWEVKEVGELKMTLRCPVSGKEMKWDRFCYLAEEKENEPWPLQEKEGSVL